MSHLVFFCAGMSLSTPPIAMKECDRAPLHTVRPPPLEDDSPADDVPELKPSGDEVLKEKQQVRSPPP